MKKFVLILLSFCLFTQVVAQSNVKFQTIDRIEMYYLDELCSFDFDYLFSSEYLNLIEELKLLNQRCQAAEN